jgi:glycosyltransferase involved in cell wall biosynthesis
VAVRVGAILIANGFSSEARVLAGMIRHRPHGDVAVFQHVWSGDAEAPVRMREAAGVDTDARDLGWRPQARGVGDLPAKVLGRVRFSATRRRLAGSMRAADVDLVLSSQQVWDCTAAAYVADRLDRPQVIHLHYIIGPWLGDVALERLRSCAHVITVSDFIRRQVIDHGVPADRVTTVRNPIEPLVVAPDEPGGDLRSELGLPAPARVVSFVARLEPYKGHAETLDAFSSLTRDHPDAHLVIVGAGQLEPELRQRASSDGVAGRVHVLGPRRDVARILAASDLFVHPSYDDPCPLAVLEAAAAGLPVVAFRSGGIPEIVEDGVTGLLADSGDVGQLADHLGALLGDTERRRAMGTAARARIESAFRPQDAAAAYWAVLDATAGGRSDSGQ